LAGRNNRLHGQRKGVAAGLLSRIANLEHSSSRRVAALLSGYKSGCVLYESPRLIKIAKAPIKQYFFIDRNRAGWLVHGAFIVHRSPGNLRPQHCDQYGDNKHK
jgi:hypothetical protein